MPGIGTLLQIAIVPGLLQIAFGFIDPQRHHGPNHFPEQGVDGGHLLGKIVQGTASGEVLLRHRLGENIEALQYPLERVLVGRQRPDPALQNHLPQNIIDERLTQFALGGEMVEKSPLGYLGLLDDLIVNGR